MFEACYRQYFTVVSAAVGRYLRGADQETVIHEVFFKLMTDAQMRQSFRGGSLGAWLSRVARNRAIDYVRKHKRETIVPPQVALELSAVKQSADPTPEQEWALFIDQFRRAYLPRKWAPVFELRFTVGLSQREAAAKLGIRRTTLAYQEQRILARLRQFIRRAEEV